VNKPDNADLTFDPEFEAVPDEVPLKCHTPEESISDVRDSQVCQFRRKVERVSMSTPNALEQQDAKSP
jgi:hypothetical protein